MLAERIPDLPVVEIPGFEVPEVDKVVLVDWCSLTIRCLEPQEVCDHVSFAMDAGEEPWIESDRGFRGYHNTLIGPDGVTLAWTEGRPDLHLELRGKACGRIGGERMRVFLQWAWDEAHATATRLDLTMDDLARRVRPTFVASEFYSERCLTRAKELDLDVSMSRQGELRKELVHIGGLSSDRYLKVYDKFLQGGENPAIRWELTYRKRLATRLLRELATRDDWGLLFAEHLKSYIDFREPGSMPRPTCVWFEELIGEATAARMALPRSSLGLGSLVEWVRHQCGPTLALIYEAMGADSEAFLHELDLKGGKRRWSRKHHQVLEDHQRAILDGTIAGEPD